MGLIHFEAMDVLMRSGNYIPFFITSIVGTAFLWLPMIIFNKFRYLIVDPSRSSMFIVGNVFSNSNVEAENVTIVKRFWRNIFKVCIEEKTYFIFSFDKTDEDFEHNIT